MRNLLPLIFTFIILSAWSQQAKTPSEFLGYELGAQFSRHHEVVDYYEYLAKEFPENLQLLQYGTTNERRPLLLAYISSEDNITNLEKLREVHLKSLNGQSESDKAIVWLSYNVHGNEAVSTEASMKTVYALLTENIDYLENTIVIVDPCINPDGRDRYSNWYNQYKNTPFQIDPNSKEHHEGWWNGRTNHYMFDLNRDWAWLTQKESQHRIKMYNKWMPHIHVDFHEQGVDNPYFFAPAAEPYHEVITNFQREFQETIGRNHAKYFDANGWFYFTKEVFDLFYPSYGDTYPTYNGAIGMTYEQGGSGRAGLAITTKIGDSLTLKDRIDHHHTTGLSTIEVAHKNAKKLNLEFNKFFKDQNFKYKSYVLKGNPDKINILTSLLDKHEIKYGTATGGVIKGLSYATGTNSNLQVDENTLVVPASQPKGTMVKVLLEPDAKLSDSLTYDITAWSLPYAYGLETMASTSKVNFTEGWNNISISRQSLNENAYAYITDWDDMNDARFLSDLLKKGVRVRASYQPFRLEGNSFDRGSLIIAKKDNEDIDNLGMIIEGHASKHSKEIFDTNTGFVDSGKDFGSGYVKMIDPPKIAVLTGEPTSNYNFGEIWHFFEQQLKYPLTVIDASYIKRVDLDAYQVFILPDGNYTDFFDESQLKNLKNWVSKGGKLLAIKGAIKGIDGEKGFKIKAKKHQSDQDENEDEEVNTTPKSFESAEREQMKNAITGAIFKVKVDNTHPLAYGYGNDYYTLKLGVESFNYLKKGNVAFLESNTTPVSGFAGSEAQNTIKESLVFGVEKVGNGNVIYFVDNPLFRGFWENGKLFFANALFMVR